MMIELSTRNISKLKPYENNARINTSAVDAVANSIREFGMNNPILIDSNDVIVAGHTRLLALKKLNIQETPVIILSGIPEEKIRAFRIADNSTAQLAEWDLQKLEKELAEIDIDMSAFGLSAQLEELQRQIEVSDADSKNIDDIPQLHENELSIVVGNIFSLGKHRLMCGDATDAAMVAKLIDGKKADMIFTDPPYGINAVDKKGKIASGKVCKPNLYVPIIGDDSTDTAEKAYSLMKELCTKQIIWGGNYFIKFLSFSDGWLVWDKREGTCKNDFSDGEMAYCSFHTPLRIYHHLWNGMIKKGESGKRLHPSQKPVKLLVDILKDFTNDNDLIVDLFGGSGSTLMACETSNRKCFMMELDPHYCNVIIKRWESLTGHKATKVI